MLQNGMELFQLIEMMLQVREHSLTEVFFGAVPQQIHQFEMGDFPDQEPFFKLNDISENR
jgi:hypothetical protein